MILALVNSPEWEILPAALKDFFASNPGVPETKTVLIPEKMWINSFDVTPETELGEWENHHEFWDLHLIDSGEEFCFIAPEVDCGAIGEYNKEDDYQLFAGNTERANRLLLHPELLLLIAPGEVHLPGISVAGNVEPHRKAVVKIHKSLLERI